MSEIDLINIPGIDRMLKIIGGYKEGLTILSTGAKKTTYNGVLYNVSGSTDDPKRIPGYRGKSWKNILVGYGIEDKNCYVTNYLPKKSKTHPKFNVGGHMTQMESGKVLYGDISYLMPLCTWHNNPARNHKPFEHTEIDVVELSGYMQGELASSFMSRAESELPYSVVFFDEKLGWQSAQISTQDALRLTDSDSAMNRFSESGASAHMLLERSFNNDLGQSIFNIKEHTFPE